MKFQFSNVVIVDGGLVGVIVKSWADKTYDVYVRCHNCVQQYDEDKISHLIYDKVIND